MELLIKTVAICVFSVISGILLRRTVPELTAILSCAVAVAAAIICVDLFDALYELAELVKASVKDYSIYLSPLIKCIGISIITTFGRSICTDASNATVASVIDTVGAVCALSVVAPLAVSAVQLILKLV